MIPNVAVNALAVDPTNPQTVYAGTSNGVYASANGGTSWSRVDVGLPFTNVRALAIDPNAPCTLIGGVDTQSFISNTTAILIVSTNCGVSWGFLPGTQAGRVAWSVALSNSNPAILYFSESRNGSLDVITRVTPPATAEYSNPGAGNYRLATDPASPCTVYAADFAGHVYGNTACASWNWAAVGGTLDGGVLSLAVHPTNGSTLLAGTNKGTIYRKADALSPWAAVATLDGLVWSIAFAPASPSTVYASGGGTIYKSTDDGVSWAPASTLGPIVSSVAPSPTSAGVVYAGSFSDQDGFYARLSLAGTLLDSTWIGGHGFDAPRGVATAPGGQVAITGYTYAGDVPVTGGAPLVTAVGDRDGFLLRLDVASSAPSIDVQPQSQTIASGQAAVLGVTATGTATLTYQWYEGTSPDTSNPIAGATSNSYTTPAISSATSYWVRVTNAYGSADSTTATVFVEAASGAELVQNGDFSSGLANWQLFEEPDIQHNSAAGGVFEYHKANPTSTGSGQAVIFQNTGQLVASGAPLVASFDIGNTDMVRKRISVLVIDSDFSDIAVCTFYLGPGAPLRTYQMKTHSTKAWTNASIYFYAASGGGSESENYRLDNVSLKYEPAESNTRTDCIDPTAPTPPGGSPGASLLVNGDFGTGLLTPWGTFGDLVSQIAGGVFEFYRPGTPGEPAGVVLQHTNQAVAANEIMTATFDLGNSSSVRKRVTVLLHDGDFSDLTACTFYLSPGQALGTYQMRSFATTAWSNATISVYAATTGSDQWIRLDNASLQRTPGTTALGTACIEPGGGPVAHGRSGSDVLSAASGATGRWPAQDGQGRLDGFLPAAAGDGWIVEATTPGLALLQWLEPIDLTAVTRAELTFESSLSAGASSGAVEVSLDGVTWQRVATVPAGAGWTTVAVDLDAYAGRVIYLRLVFDRVVADVGAPADEWRIGAIAVRQAFSSRRARAAPHRGAPVGAPRHP